MAGSSSFMSGVMHLMKSSRYRSRADFDEGDFRLMIPRFSEENFTKNLVVTDEIKAIADKYNATPSQVTLAWILAEYDNSKRIFSPHLQVLI